MRAMSSCWSLEKFGAYLHQQCFKKAHNKKINHLLDTEWVSSGVLENLTDLAVLRTAPVTELITYSLVKLFLSEL